MPTLSSILVQRGAASMRAVEDAIARQVFHGGDLVTNLLEIGGVREEALMPLVAESFGLEVAPGGRLRLPLADVLRLVPGELALRHGIFPLALRDRTLVVAVAEPLVVAVEDDLGFALDLAIRQLIAPLVRIRQAIADGYGLPLDRRFLRLQAKLDGRADPSPSALPPAERELLPMKMPRGVSIPSPSFGTGVPGSDSEPARLEDVPATKTPFVAHPQQYVDVAIPRSPAVPTHTAVEESPAPPTVVSEDHGRPVPAEPVEAGMDHDPPVPAEAIDAAAMGAKPPTVVATRALAGVLRQAIRAERAVDKTREGGRPAWKPAQPRRKGPFTTAMAEEELESATTSDAVLEVAFAFAHQFFEYAALFVVNGDLAEGRDATGPGADRARVAGLGVPLDLPSRMALARDRRGPVIALPSSDGLDVELVRDLGRGARAAAFLPVVVRSRTVAIVYGDDGAIDVQLSALGEVIAMMALAGAALERIALRKKLGGRAPEIPLKVRIQDGAAALARAISSSAIDAVASAANTERDPLPFPPTPEADGVSMFSATVAMMAGDPYPVTMGGDPPYPPALPVGSPPADADPLNPPLGFVQEAVARTPLPPGPADHDEGRLAVLPVPPAPRTARYFDDSPPVPPKRSTDPGLGIAFPEQASPDSGTPPPSLRAPESEAPARPAAPADTPPPPKLDSWMPLGERATLQMEAVHPEPAVPPVPASRRQSPGRRGPAPLYEGRAAAVPDGASIEWTGAHAQEGARTLPSMGLAPLPRTPPPNATSWTSFPSQPPPPTFGAPSAPRTRAERPLPREEDPPPPGRRSVPPPDSLSGDLTAEYKDLVQRVLDEAQRGPRGQDAFDELVRNGEHVIQAVMARFPGPLRVDRHRARAELPPASQCGPLLELVVAIRRPALPFVSVRTSSADPEVRFWATHVLGELRYPEAATVLVPRLFDDDSQVRRVARRSAAALVGAGNVGAPILKGLEDITGNPDQPNPHRVMAIETMGEIRSGSLVPSLLDALEDSSGEVAEAARRALLLVTRQDFAHDTLRWNEWWSENAGRHRVEWLIDGLMHEQPSVRRASGDELKLVTKEYFGYYDDLPRRERERAQALYRSWWEREGRQRFTSS